MYCVANRTVILLPQTVTTATCILVVKHWGEDFGEVPYDGRKAGSEVDWRCGNVPLGWVSEEGGSVKKADNLLGSLDKKQTTYGSTLGQLYLLMHTKYLIVIFVINLLTPV